MYIYNDGGRKAAGFKGTSGDCAVRAVAIAVGMNYREARSLLKDHAAKGKMGSRAIARGVYKEDLDSALQSIGWTWCKAPVFVGRKARYYDINGVAIVSMAKHFAAVVDGVLYDSWDSSRKMVYGYWARQE